MNREELRRLIKKKTFTGLILGFMFGFIIAGIILAPMVYEENLKYEAVSELFMFSLNVSIYCAELNNITTQEVLDGYVIKMAHDIVSDVVYTEGVKDEK